MKRLLTILIILGAVLIAAIYANISITAQNDSLQQQIEALLQEESPSADEVKNLVDACHDLTGGLGMVLNDDKVSTVSFEAYAVLFASENGDPQGMREALFLLSRALEDLTEAEQLSFQSLM